VAVNNAVHAMASIPNNSRVMSSSWKSHQQLIQRPSYFFGGTFRVMPQNQQRQSDSDLDDNVVILGRDLRRLPIGNLPTQGHTDAHDSDLGRTVTRKVSIVPLYTAPPLEQACVINYLTDKRPIYVKPINPGPRVNAEGERPTAVI
jgi:hypothetical protein